MAGPGTIESLNSFTTWRFQIFQLSPLPRKNNDHAKERCFHGNQTYLHNRRVSSQVTLPSFLLLQVELYGRSGKGLFQYLQEKDPTKQQRESCNINKPLTKFLPVVCLFASFFSPFLWQLWQWFCVVTTQWLTSISSFTFILNLKHWSVWYWTRWTSAQSIQANATLTES